MCVLKIQVIENAEMQKMQTICEYTGMSRWLGEKYAEYVNIRYKYMICSKRQKNMKKCEKYAGYAKKYAKYMQKMCEHSKAFRTQNSDMFIFCILCDSESGCQQVQAALGCHPGRSARASWAKAKLGPKYKSEILLFSRALCG
jgi:hypothetical protein